MTSGPLDLTHSGPGNTLTIQGPGANLLSVSGNNASRVLVSTGGTASVSGLTITGGTAGGGGGGGGAGLYLSGNAAKNITLTDCAIAGNSTSGNGGGVRFTYSSAASTLSLVNCTVSGNTAGFFGGGVYIDGGPTSLNMTNCTVTGNSASFRGGGVAQVNFSSASLFNCTVTGNSGGGIYSYAGVSLKNVIVAGQTSGGNVDGPFSGSNNLIGGTPLLAPLGYHGGTTRTMPPLPGSPAIDAGTATGAPTTDQRGKGRVGATDIGAIESQGYVLAITGGNSQTTPANAAFANPLAVSVTANDANDPVNGGVVIFTPPASGASAVLSAASATIANGAASVAATANATPGSYVVAAAAKGAASVSFSLLNFGLVSIAVSPANPSIAKGLTRQFTATGTFSDNSTQDLTATATWESATTAVATIDAGGLATGVDVGSSQIRATMGGVSGSTTLTVTAPPTANVVSTTVSWGASGNSGPLVTQSGGLRLLPSGRNLVMPWLGINRFTITLSATATLSPSDVTVTGNAVANYGPVTISGNGTTFTITLARPINAADRVTVSFGNAGIDAYTRRIDVLPGDVNDDGYVNSTAAVSTRAAALNQSVPILLIFLDVNGDGVVDMNDFNLVRARSGQRLPGL